ncbi:hypothetical protein CAPTEDRAFT_227099 [Capitella teleta]|uniref:Receptor protein-tyrosine kinase n=1 Tax=Capitella teleta TaxID=283909 RepID=R7TCA5_CAPTE|nr:hypothetical protein CAPTEDRAFT_227099 [Capitella teleta]|eukprot:ELT91319.1 hypothetical protein CAPTEDRAFT_227099 [Capitella teleta]
MASWCVLLLISVFGLHGGHSQEELYFSKPNYQGFVQRRITNRQNKSRREKDLKAFAIPSDSWDLLANTVTEGNAPGDASIQGYIFAMAGDDVTLTCSVDDRGNPPGTYKWKKPNGGTQDGKNLNIENLNVDEDEGEYECYVENEVAQGTSATHALTVNSVPGVERDIDSEKSVVNTDDSFSVSCAFRAKPAASVVWKREDDSALPSHIFFTLTTQEADGKFTITTSTLTWSGTDADARRGKGGKMFCKADNGIRDAVKSNTMDLIIQYAPYGLSITPGSSSVELNEGDNLPDRVCSANCEPSCSYTWHFNSEDGGVVENSDTLSMQNVQRGKHGSYFCKASNEIHPSAHDNFDLIVNYGPEIQEFKTTPQDGSIIESNSTTFSCSADTRPGATIRLTGPQGWSVTVGDKTELQYTIHDIGCIYSGTYTCTSNNRETGIEVDKTMDIQVKCSPSVQVIYPEDRIHGVAEGASVFFFVEAISHPTPDFQWKRTFNNGTTVNLPSDDSGNKSNLTITNIKMEDFGNYTVSANNYIGRWEAIKFELRALNKPHPPTDLSSEATAISLTLSWTPGWDGGPPQTFTITYSTSRNEKTISDIPDSPDSTRILYKLTYEIFAEKLYSFEIFATNSQGSSEVVFWNPITTPDFPSFKVNSITIEGDQALIKWTLDQDLVDRVLVRAARRTENENFVETNVTDFDQDPVVVGLPSASSFIFDFYVYKGDDLLLSQPQIQPDVVDPTNLGLIIGLVVAILVLIALGVVAFFVIQKYRKPKKLDDLQLDPSQSPIPNQDPVAPGGAYETIDPLPVIDPPPEYEEIRLGETEPYSVMMRPIAISDLNLDASSNVDSMFCLQKGTLIRKGQPPTNILIMQSETNSTQEQFAAKYLEMQLEIMEKLRNISNIEIPLGFVLQQSLSETCRRKFDINSTFTGFRQPVFKHPAFLLSDHLKKEKVIYENVTPKSQQIYQNAQTVQPDMLSIFIGISNGLAQLHEVGALVYGLNTESVFIHEENGRLIAKLISFSEASLVRQRDRLDIEMGERDVRRLAPETIDSLEHTCKSDVWVMAILFWESISGCEPYKTYADDSDAEAAIVGGSKLEKPMQCAPKMYDVMMKCWMLDPQNRPSAVKIAKKLSNIKSHRFPDI